MAFLYFFGTLLAEVFYLVAVVFFLGKKTTTVKPVVNRLALKKKRQDKSLLAGYLFWSCLIELINRLVIARLFYLFKPGLHVRRKHKHTDVYTYDKHNRAAGLLFGARFDSNMAD